MPLCRRVVLAVAAVALTGPAWAAGRATDFIFEAIEGGPLPLANFRGRVMLVVNTASFCGYTYQYKALEAVHAALLPRGLTVVGVPSQDFNQEKDSSGKVKAFCDSTFGVKFPMAAITRVTGTEAHPFYRWVKQTSGWEPRWNFHKVLVGRDGMIAGLYGSDEEPDGPRLSTDMAAALAVTS